MENLGDYAYLIILLIIFVVNAIAGKAAKKRKQQEREGGAGEGKTSEAPPRKGFEDILRELLGEQESNQQPPTVVPPSPPQTMQKEVSKPKPVREKKKTQIQYKNPYQEYLEKNPKLATSGRQRIVGLPALEVEDFGDHTESAGPFEFDLRDAVIYSEILKRKY